MLLITDNPEIVATFVGRGLMVQFHPPYTAMGWVVVRPDGEWRLVGGAVFHDYNGANIEVSIYGPGALTRQSLIEGLRYVFGQLKCIRLTAKTRRGNARMRKLLPRLGFKWEGELKGYYGPTRAENALVFRLDAAGAERWTGHGQRTDTPTRTGSDRDRQRRSEGQYRDGIGAIGAQ